MAVTEEPQLGLDERELEGAQDLLEALEEREKRKASVGALRKQYREADEKAKGLLASFELQDGEVARCGRFRILKKAVPPRTVAFETNPASRITIVPDKPLEL